MKEELIKKLIETKGLRAWYVQKYINTYIFWGKWEAEIEKCDAIIKEITHQLELLN